MAWCQVRLNTYKVESEATSYFLQGQPFNNSSSLNYSIFEVNTDQTLTLIDIDF